MREIARADGITERYVAKILPLAFLAPGIKEAILQGLQPPGLTLDQLCQPLPLAWPEQSRALGFHPQRRPDQQLAPAPGRCANRARRHGP
jgi:hypothetical protein